MTMTFKTFEEKFNELSFSDRLSIYNEYCLNYRSGDDMIYNFDEEFFDMAFSSPIDAARATFFGNIQSWNDEYIRFNAYGNLESLSEYDAEGEFEYELENIYEYCDCWRNYIDFEEDEEEEDNEEE